MRKTTTIAAVVLFGVILAYVGIAQTEGVGAANLAIGIFIAAIGLLLLMVNFLDGDK